MYGSVKGERPNPGKGRSSMYGCVKGELKYGQGAVGDAYGIAVVQGMKHVPTPSMYPDVQPTMFVP